MRCVQLVAVSKLTARCHKVLHTGPLSKSGRRTSFVMYLNCVCCCVSCVAATLTSVNDLNSSSMTVKRKYRLNILKCDQQMNN